MAPARASAAAAVAETEVLVIDMKRLSHIREIDVNARTARIDAGILGQHLEDQLGSLGWMTAPLIPHPSHARPRAGTWPPVARPVLQSLRCL